MKHQATKGRRMGYKYTGVTTLDNKEDLWWGSDRAWKPYDKSRGRWLCSHAHYVKTLRAFRRHLRKYGVPGVRYVLVSRFVGYDVEAVCRRKK